MVWLHVVLDGIAMGGIFALTLCLVSLLDPQSFTRMYPIGIQKIAPKIPEDSNKRKNKMLLILWPAVLIFSICSTFLLGIRGFKALFLAGYIQMFCVDMADFFGWNILFREKMGRKLELPGTEGSELYSLKNWLLKLALPNHFGLWLVIICPLCGLIDAGIVSLLAGLWGY